MGNNPNRRLPTVRIFEGSIYDAPSKNLLISIGENRVLKGMTALAALEKFGQSLQDELLAQPPFEKWEVRMVERMPYRLFFGRPFDYRVRQLTLFGVEACLKSALAMCDELGLESLAMSALAARYLPDNEAQIDVIAHLGIQDYFDRHPESGVREIWLVNHGSTVFTENPRLLQNADENMEFS